MSEISAESDEKTIAVASEDQKIDPSIEKKIVRKIDIRIIPLFTLSYFLCNLERSNIANAKIAGFVPDTGISESAYNNALSLFFVGVIIFDIPSNLLSKKIGINIWFPIIMIGWALCSLLHAFVTNASQLYTLRLLLGVFEGGLAPIQIYYYTIWYTPNEISVRTAVSFGFSMTASAFSGLMAYGIVGNMDGLGGLHGWQWIFILEAIPSFLLAIVFYLVVPKEPERAKFLTKEELSIVYKRLQIHAPPKKFSKNIIKKQTISALTDFKIYVFSIMTFASAVLANSMLLFTPTIVRDLGFDSLKAQALSAPPFILSSIALTVNAWISSLKNERSFFIAIPDSIAAFSLVVTISIIPTNENLVLRYVIICITIPTMLSYLAVYTTWFATNIAGQYKRAVGLSVILGIGQIGGIAAGQVYKQDDAPRYLRGHSIILSFIFIHLTLTLIMRFIFVRINKKKDLLQQNYDNNNDDIKGKEFEERYNEELFENHPNWRYFT